MCQLNKNYLNNVYYNTPQIQQWKLDYEEKRNMKEVGQRPREWRMNEGRIKQTKGEEQGEEKKTACIAAE